MITIISGTNRPGSKTLQFATASLELLSEMDEDVQLLDLATIAPQWLHTGMYTPADITPELLDIQKRFVLNVDAFVIIVPEYNGSYPGMMKLFIDAISVNEYPSNFKNKAFALIGVASGRAGNLRGIDHLADTIAHMGGWVLPNKLPLSGVEALLNEDGKVTDEATLTSLRSSAEQLIAARNRNLIYK
ncbi:NADPH-dependent FMN reductase [Neolewinella agarilytica]|uniref:NAD(P)H-dependent FMN reductase n=1 Tax=Neolewinella agarilytica TaxID=478744 RepID=A0A1H9N942_9BACT|nr:NAD(P)H-dependent oxidoreductase [Neolewinella agarilytica]SER32506.1 NAD(P)H-dependent FMN reductase [Neolewinella agarilytica]